MKGQKTTLHEAAKNYDDLVTFMHNNPRSLTDSGTMKRYNRFANWWKDRAGHDGNYNTFFQKLGQYEAYSTTSTNSTQVWESVGPRHVDLTIDERSNIGRVNAIWIDPADNNHMLIGSASAGMWETTNGGTNWNCITPNLPGGVSKILVHPTNSSIVYGLLTVHINGFYGHKGGYGIFKSTEGGYNAEKMLPEIYTEHKGVTDICFKPGDPNTVYVLTHHSMYKISGNQVDEFAINAPDDRSLVDFGFSEQYPDIGFAYDGIHLYRTIDGGETWSDVSDHTPQDYMAQWSDSLWSVHKPSVQNGGYYKRNSYYRNQMAVKGNSVYLHRLRVKDSGNDTVVAFELVKSPMHSMAFNTLFESEEYWDILFHRDCFFFEFAPDDKLVLGHIGKISYFDEGTEAFGILRNIHADVRDIDFYGNTIHDFISVTDGGVEYNGVTYICGDLALNEIHGHDIFSKKRDWCHVGTHDDGTFAFNDQNWWNSGNNEGAVAYQNLENFDTYIDLDAYTPGDVWFRLPNSGKTIFRDGVGMSDHFAVDPHNPNHVWVPQNYHNESAQQCVRFLKYDATNPFAGALEEIFFKHWFGQHFLLRFGHQDPDFMIASAFAPWGKNYLSIALSHDKGQTWTHLVNSSPFEELRSAHLKVSDIEINPGNDNEIWVTMSRFMENGNVRVLHSTDKGATWSDMTSNLPDIPVLQVEYHPISDRLFIGSEVGLFEYNEGSEVWEQHQGFPIVPVTSIHINDIYQDLTVGTYGRGLWRTNLSCATGNDWVVNSNQTWNHDKYMCNNLRISNGATLTLNANLSMSPAAKIIVDENSTLVAKVPLLMNTGTSIVFKPGSRLVVNNTEVELSEYATLVLEGTVNIQLFAGQFINSGQFEYNANDTLNIMGYGTVDLYAQSNTAQQLNLQGRGGELVFVGRNVVINSSVGFSKVVLKPHGELIFDNYIFPGLNFDCANGTAVFSNMWYKVFENISVTNGEASIVNSTFSMESQNVFKETLLSLNNVIVAGGSGAMVLRNSGIKLSENVTFKDGTNRYGTLQLYRTDSKRTQLSNINFINNKIAVYSYSGSVDILRCTFRWNKTSWKAENMTAASSVNYSNFSDNELGIAIDYAGYNNASLQVNNSAILNQKQGIIVSGPLTLDLFCNHINQNSMFGVALTKQASLIAKTNDLSGNNKAIVSLGTLDGANHLYIDNGNNHVNSLSYSVSGIWNHGSNLYARQNKWNNSNSSPVWGVDYLMFSRLCLPGVNYSPITIIDDSPMQRAPECLIFSDKGGPTSQGEGSKNHHIENLIALADEQYNLGNYKNSADLYYELLMDDMNLVSENWDDIWYSYLRFQGLSGLIDNYHILFDLNTIQDHLLSVVPEDDYQSKLYLHITKAQTMRLQNDFEGAIDYFNYILSFVNDEDYEQISQLRCQVLVDKQILAGEIMPYELSESLDICISESLDRKSNINDDDKLHNNNTEGKYMTISPNPASSSVIVIVDLPEEYSNCVLQVVNQQQRILLSKQLMVGHSSIEFNVNELEGPGFYFVLIKHDGSIIEANELVVE